jgi:hypothetical protein
LGRLRKGASWVVGGIQCGLGGLASVVAFLVYASPSFRETLAIASEETYLYMFLLLVFGVFSILSGLLLVHGERQAGI